ncbi:MAG TPA: TRAP transporter small permease [Usitatibacter sp.]|nr:TRAP transporter small permease [Usitatibacter sp.]
MTAGKAARFVRAVDAMSTVCAVIAAACLAAAMLIVVYMVIWRATGHSTFWEIELATYLIVACVLVGSPYCLRTKGHIGVDLVSHLLAPSKQVVLERVLAVFGLAVCLYLAWEGLDLTLHAWRSGETSGTSWDPPRWPFFALMPLGLGLTALQYVAEMLRDKPLQPSAISGQGA